jgi:hypothetical protein
MMVRVAMEVQQGGTGGISELGQNSLVTTLADVHDAFDGHGASLPPVLGSGRVRPRRS